MVIKIRLEQGCFKFTATWPVAQKKAWPLYLPTLDMVHSLLGHYYHQEHDSAKCVVCQGTQDAYWQPPETIEERYGKGTPDEHWQPGDMSW